MKIFLEKENKEISIRFSGKVKELLKVLKINSEDVLAVKDGELLDENDKIKDNERIELLSVVSGG